jgi:uncharacterized protein YndB with AHSA1/START domain
MDAQLSAAGDRWQLRFVRHLPHVQEKVWRALTEPEHLAAWFPDEIQGDMAPGAPLRFHMAEHEEYDFNGEVLAFEPPSLLELRWGEDLLRFELEGSGDSCVLTFTDTFDEVGKAARDGAGWHVCLDQLERDLAGTARIADERSRWTEVHTRYVDALGPEAATIGPPEGF